MTTGTSDGNTVTAGIGPLGLGFTDTSARSTTVATDPTGTSTTQTGSATGGVSGTFGGVTVGNYTETGSITTKTGPDNTATGDVSKSTSEGELWDTVKHAAAHPWDTVTGLFTGSAKLEQKTDVAGMKLTDDDYVRIAWTATNQKAWFGLVISPRDIPDWRTCRHRILSSGGDRNVMATALADFVAGDSMYRPGMVQRAVRWNGEAEGGARYEWPGELAGQKATFESIVDGDPLAAITAAQEAGNYEPAAKLAADDIAKLDAVLAAMQAHQDLFADPAAYGEMLRRAGERRAELVGRAHLVARHAPAPTETTVPTAAQTQDQADADKAAAKARYEGLMKSLQGFLDMQTRAFAFVQAEQAKEGNLFSKPDIYAIAPKLTELKDNVYPEWDSAFEAAVEAAKAAGLPAPTEPKPAREWWQHLNDISFHI